MSKHESDFKSSLTRFAQSCSKLARLVGTFETYREKGSNPYNLERMLDKIKKISSSLDTFSSFPGFSEWLNQAQSTVSELKSNYATKVAATLNELVNRDGFTLQGSIPELKVFLYTIVFDQETGFASIWYGDKREFLDRCVLDPNVIYAKLKKIHTWLTLKRFEPSDFVRRLYEAYKRVTGSNGGSAPIVKVLYEFCLGLQSEKFVVDPIRKNFNKYGRVLFSYDLYRLPAEFRVYNDKRFELITATMRQSKKRSEHMWVPKNDRGDGTVYSFIVFR